MTSERDLPADRRAVAIDDLHRGAVGGHDEHAIAARRGGEQLHRFVEGDAGGRHHGAGAHSGELLLGRQKEQVAHLRAQGTIDLGQHDGVGDARTGRPYAPHDGAIGALAEHEQRGVRLREDGARSRHRQPHEESLQAAQRGVGRENPDYYALQVMNYILGGGGFSSRAMDSIRNQRGLAYSVYSYFNADKGRGTFQFVMQTKNETALQAIAIAKEEIGRIREAPVSEAELNDAKDYLTGSFPLRFDTMGKVANFLAQAEYFELGLDYIERYPDLIGQITIDDVKQAAQKYLEPEKMVTVIVGNQTIIAGK